MAPSNLAKLLSCFMSEVNRLDDSVVTLIKEAIPGLSTDANLLPEWQTETAIPTACMKLANPSMTEEQRRSAVHSLITLRGNVTDGYSNLSPQFFIDLAASASAAITITYGGGAGEPYRPNAPATLYSSGTAGGPTSGKLIDGSATFQTDGVMPNNIVLNISNGTQRSRGFR